MSQLKAEESRELKLMNLTLHSVAHSLLLSTWAASRAHSFLIKISSAAAHHHTTEDELTQPFEPC